MKLKNRDILNLNEALAQLKDKPLVWGASYAIVRTIKHLGDHLIAIEAARKAAIAPFTPEGKDGVDPTDPGFADAVKAVNELFDAENEVELHQFDASLLKDASISPAVAQAILPMLTGI